MLVEQSVNIALSVATTAHFMERGRIRFSGPAHELAARPDLLRAVFVTGETSTASTRSASTRARPDGHGADPALQLQGVTRRFGGIVAVDEVSFDVAPGEVVGLIGQNGAGKTTLFDLICGYQPLDAGRVLLAGHDLAHDAPHRRAPARPRLERAALDSGSRTRWCRGALARTGPGDHRAR